MSQSYGTRCPISLGRVSYRVGTFRPNSLGQFVGGG